MESEQGSILAGSNEGREGRVKRAFRLSLLPVLIIFCTLFYYFGELVDWAAWETFLQLYY